jgi:hypothetical protein
MKQEATAERRDDRKGPPESRESLWMLTFGPAIWSVHLLLSYVTAAVWCAKVVGRSGSLDGVRIAVAVYTVLALLGIGLTAWRGYRQQSFGSATVPHDFDTAADRHRFLGFATLLLSGLSFVATIYVALPILFIGSCQ